ncbi:hypothetical protein RUE5091_00124 [Ruegeria denitrificans]|uniref:PD-(D/E)XK motif protein n=1 Tax=Ruegeria denitrificans TaxID=1715692 RepID=A0A0P1I0S4_9RHOB|nr:PD-(D/E)XK motif protein [Ruegeria denitrificans]CUJ83553.1 hypothetical protein RUE5091_00124 [Ruegeria denitrificans]
MAGSRNHWQFLRSGGDEPTGLEIPTRIIEVRTSHGPLRMALGSSGELRFLLPVGMQTRVPKIPVGPNVAISDVIYSLGKERLRFIDITCGAAELESVFADVVDQIVERIADGQAALEAASSTFAEFRNLLLSKPVSSRPRTEVVGLVGELLVLTRLLKRNNDAWRSWSGADRDRHDFRAGDYSIEIKSTSRSGNMQVTIHSEHQLSTPNNGALQLFHFTFEAVSGGEYTVERLADEALHASSDPQAFLDRLKACGCEAPDSPEWNEDAFRLDAESAFRVEGDFPRITPKSFQFGMRPSGVKSIQYDLDLSTALGFLATLEQKNSHEDLLLGCL